LDSGILTADSKLGGIDKNSGDQNQNQNPNPVKNNSKPKDSTPYYKRLNFIPRVYKFASMAPLALSAIAVLLAILMVFAHPSHRKGIRRVATTALVAGLVLIATLLVGRFGFTKLQHNVLDKGSATALQTSILDVAHNAITGITTVNAYIGAGFVALAVVIYFILFRTRSGAGTTKQPRTNKPSKEVAAEESVPETIDETAPEIDDTQAVPVSTPSPTFGQAARKRPAMDMISPVKKPSAPIVPEVSNNPKQSVKKRPRLVQ
jgi:hypothetical protein